MTGREYGLHKHHIFGGAWRDISEREGFWVYLYWSLHTGNMKAVHNNFAFDKALKQECQAKYEETHTREEFIKLIGRSFL